MMLMRPRFLSTSRRSSGREPLLRTLSEASRTSSSSYSSSARPPAPRPSPSSNKRPPPNLRRLTARIVDLTRRRQLAQIMAEVEASKRRARTGRGGGINIIVMNAVLEACVSCGDVDLAVQLFDEMRGPMGCGVDGVSYGILLKGLGIARRIDEAFEILESVEKHTSDGSPRLSPHLICGLLNALIEAGDMRRANALVARFRQILYEGQSVLLYNLLMKGYIKSNFPLGALTVKDEILRQGLKPDRLTYNTIIFACVKSAEIEKAFQFLKDMKDEAQRDGNPELLPDAVTYTTLLKGLGNSQDLYSVLKIVVEMKSSLRSIDRTAYTAMADAFLACGSIDGALCIFGEIIKQAGNNKDLRPKPHLYLSIMRAFATIGDFDMVRRLKKRMRRDSVGSISRSAKQEANELLMEAAINNNQIDVARGLLRRIVNGKEYFSWTSRVGLVALKVETLSGFTNSPLRPHVFPQIILNDPVEKYMIPFRESRPLCADLILENVTMRFLKDSAVPLVNDWGSCVGIICSRDCTKAARSPDRIILAAPPRNVSPPEVCMLQLEEMSQDSASSRRQRALPPPLQLIRCPRCPANRLRWFLSTTEKNPGIRFYKCPNYMMDAPLLSMAKPPLCVPSSTSLEHAIDLLLREKCEMVVVVKSGNMYEGSYTSSARPLGVFSLRILSEATGATTANTQQGP